MVQDMKERIQIKHLMCFYLLNKQKKVLMLLFLVEEKPSKQAIHLQVMDVVVGMAKRWVFAW
jgi:hypothetical protein